MMFSECSFSQSVEMSDMADGLSFSNAGAVSRSNAIEGSPYAP
jgi:hypothetical protein